VKAVGEGVLAAFSEPEAAVQVGLALPGLLARGTATRDLRPRAAIHHGAAFAATLDDRLDYFGTTVSRVARLLPLARGGEVVLSRAVAADPRVAALLRARGLEGEVLAVDLPGCGPALRLRPAPLVPVPAADQAGGR
jgi:class 3 adenylate cyclase